MSGHEENESLKIVDTSDSLTKDELQELKRLASLSKTARTVIAVVIGAIMLVGGDKLLGFLQSHTPGSH